MRGLEDEKGHIYIQMNLHCHSMKESADSLKAIFASKYSELKKKKYLGLYFAYFDEI